MLNPLRIKIGLAVFFVGFVFYGHHTLSVEGRYQFLAPPPPGAEPVSIQFSIGTNHPRLIDAAPKDLVTSTDQYYTHYSVDIPYFRWRSVDTVKVHISAPKSCIPAKPRPPAPDPQHMPPPQELAREAARESAARASRPRAKPKLAAESIEADSGAVPVESGRTQLPALTLDNKPPSDD